MKGINWNNLRRKRAFHKHVNIQIPPEYEDTQNKKLLDFSRLPDIFPLKLKEGQQHFSKDDIFDFENATEEMKKEFLSKFEPIDKRKLDLKSKPIAIVYNTNSGTKLDLRPKIAERLD